MEFLLRIETWAALLSLVVLEIVLGVDNIVFISLVSSKLDKDQQERARVLGLSLAMFSRIALLCSMAWVMTLRQPLFSMLGLAVCGKDILFLGGGFFLVIKAIQEIHAEIDGDEEEIRVRRRPSLTGTVVQIILLDVIFSLDSVVTAIGLTSDLTIMIAAVVLAVALTIKYSGMISRFIDERPSVKMLAFSFLLLIGFVLVAEGFGNEIPKGYIYSAIGFSLAVEMLNCRRRKPTRVKQDQSQCLENDLIAKHHPWRHVSTLAGGRFEPAPQTSIYCSEIRPPANITGNVCIQRLGAIDYEFFDPGRSKPIAPQSI